MTKTSLPGSGHQAGYDYASSHGWSQEDVDTYRAEHPNNTSFAEGAQNFVNEATQASGNETKSSPDQATADQPDQNQVDLPEDL